MTNKNSRFAMLMALAALTMSLVACGGGDDEESRMQENASSYASETSIDVSQLPADFPRELVPPSYDTIEYVDMRAYRSVESVNFESGEPVGAAIDHYVRLLGEPKIKVDSDDGERISQWHTTPYPPWAVSVIGNDGETIVSVAKPPAE